MKRAFAALPRRITAFLLSLVLLFVYLPLSVLAEEGDREGVMIADAVRVRKGPGINHDALKHNGVVINLYHGHKLTVHGDAVESSDGDPLPWYSVTFNFDGTEYSGYIRSDFVQVIDPSDPTVKPEPAPPNLSFDEQLALFPESYHASLKALHELHPSWNFEVFDTGLDWNVVLQNENVYGRSMTNSKYVSYYSTVHSYDWETDTHSPLEAGVWYQASPALVAYHMDPRNFLTDTEVFQFEKLTYSAASQTEEAIASMLKGSFMADQTTPGPDGEPITYAKAFLLAAQAAKVSAFHLVTRCIQEVGWQGQSYCKGTYPGYEGYYNFFNIGAHNGAEAGMVYAKNEGWDSAYKAIYYGAFFIVNGYIAAGQDTPYFQKFSVVDPDKYYWHQYMTNIAAASSEGKLQRAEYVELGLIDSALTFRIPVYKNMPASPAPIPAATGSSNNYLRSLSIEGQSLTPSFDFYDTLNNGTDTYTLIISGNLTHVTVNAVPASASAHLSGHVGQVPIATGENVLTITVTAASGAVKNYTIRIILNVEGSPEGPGDGGGEGQKPPEPQPIPSGWDPKVTIRGTRISGVKQGTSVNEFIASLGLFGRAAASVTAPDGSGVSGGAIRTGYRLNYFDGSHTTVFIIVIYGDPNGDSAIDAIDLLMVRRYLLGLTSLSNEYLEAADANHDGTVDAIDLLLIRRYLLNLSSIEQ